MRARSGSRSASPCSGSTGRTRISAASAGTIASGVVRAGDRVRVQPSGRESRVARIVTAAGDLDRAIAGQSVTLTLADEVDVSRGDVIAAADAPAEVADQFEAIVVWMGEEPMLRGRSYLMRIGAKTVPATVAPLKYRINVDTLEHLAAEKLELNEIGACELELGERDRVRSVRREPRDGRIRPDRPADQSDRRRGNAEVRAAARPQHPPRSTSTSTRRRAPR